MQWNLNYQAILPLLNTGDIMLFSSQSIGSQIIRLFTRSKWSHVGMVFREGHKLFSWEGDVIIKGKPSSLGVYLSSVSMIEFEERIKNYEGEIAIRRLTNISEEEHKKNQAILKMFSEEVKDRPFEELNLELIKAAYDGPLGENIENLSRIFCSELVAAAYQRLGFLPPHPPGLPSNEYTPADFGRNNFSLLNKALTEPIFIKFTEENVITTPTFEVKSAR